MATLADILALLPDNTAGDISAQDVRDAVTAQWHRTDGTDTIEGLAFNTAPPVPAHVAGRVFWNATDGTLNMMSTTPGVTLQIGQEQWADVRNNSGSTILNGRAVRITGGIGSTPTIGLDNGLGTGIGIATQDIANNANGKVTTFGLVRDLNTSAFTEGQAVYSSSTGTLTASVTSSFLGYVTDSHVSAGTVLVARLRTDTASGTTAQRPTLVAVGARYFDTTLGIPIWWKGAVWVNASGATV